MKRFFIFFLLFFFACSSTPMRPVFKKEYYWNPQKDLNLPLNSPIKIKSSQIIFTKSSNLITKTISFKSSSSNLILKTTPFFKKIRGNAIIEIKDFQDRLFLFNLILDSDPPKIRILSYSSLIRTGGTAIVIFKTKEPFLKESYIKDAVGKRFYAVPFMTSDTFITFIVWQIWLKSDQFTIVAKDQAGNIAKRQVPIRTKIKKYPKSDLKISESFFREKTKELPVSSKLTQKKAQYHAITKAMQKTKKIRIPKITSIRPDFFSLNTNAFHPLNKARITSTFGKIRRYLYRGQAMKRSYHLGVDLAGTPEEKILTQSGGIVIFSGYNGGYGKTLLLSHGMGLYSIYSHCSKLLFEKGDWIAPHSVIAYTGKTGFATGDHLHFGIIIQGAYANPLEWMNQKWIRRSILKPVHEARKKILSHLDKEKVYSEK